MKDERTRTAIELMSGFAERTGLTSARPVRRYLWTDAFAVCNFLGLAESTSLARYTTLARSLVDQVHHTLGKHRPDDVRTGWISGLDASEGEQHPTRGGLRIGKALPERSAGEPFDERLEWERDGQYFHYLTKWMHALDQLTRSTGDPIFNQWGRELAEKAHLAFTRFPPDRMRMIWKASIDLTRAAVPTMGQHDPVDGFVTSLQLERTGGSGSEPGLQRAMVDFAAMIDVRALATSDPLGIGGLLVDAVRLQQLITGHGTHGQSLLLEAMLDAAWSSLSAFVRSPQLGWPATHRLAFRELGLTIGLAAADLMHELPGRGFVHGDATLPARFAFLREEIESFWLRPENRRTSTWTDHADINDVMLATSLVPRGFLLLRTAP